MLPVTPTQLGLAAPMLVAAMVGVIERNRLHSIYFKCSFFKNFDSCEVYVNFLCSGQT